MSAVSAKSPITAKSTKKTADDAVAQLQDQRAKLTENIRTFISKRVERDDLWKSGIYPWQRVDLIIDYAYELDGADAALKAALADPSLAENDIRFVRLLTMQWSDATTRLEKLEQEQKVQPKPVKSVSKIVKPSMPSQRQVTTPSKPFSGTPASGISSPVTASDAAARPLSSPAIPLPPARAQKISASAMPSVLSASAAQQPLSELESKLSKGLRALWKDTKVWREGAPLERRWSILVDFILEPSPEHRSVLETELSVVGKTTIISACEALRQDLRELYAHPEFSSLAKRVEKHDQQAAQTSSTDWVAEFVPEAELNKLFTELEGLLDDEQKLKANEARAKDIFANVQKILSDSREQLDDEYEFLGMTPLERQLVLFRIGDYRRRYRSRMRHLRQDLRELHGHPADTFFPEGNDDVLSLDTAPDALAKVSQTPAPAATTQVAKKKTVGDTLERVLDYVAGGWNEVGDKQKQEEARLDTLVQTHDDADELSAVTPPPEPEPIAFVPEDSSVRLAGQTIPQVLEQAIKAHPERYGADMTGDDLEQYLYGRTMALRLSATLGGAQYAFTPQAVGVVQVFPEFQEASGDWKATLAVSGKRSTLETLLKDGYLQQK